MLYIYTGYIYRERQSEQGFERNPCSMIGGAWGSKPFKRHMIRSVYIASRASLWTVPRGPPLSRLSKMLANPIVSKIVPLDHMLYRIVYHTTKCVVNMCPCFDLPRNLQDSPHSPHSPLHPDRSYWTPVHTPPGICSSPVKLYLYVYIYIYIYIYMHIYIYIYIYMQIRSNPTPHPHKGPFIRYILSYDITTNYTQIYEPSGYNRMAGTPSDCLR